MWKVLAFLILVVVLGQLAVRYVRVNPLGPRVEGNELLVESQEYSVRFQRNGAFAGTYLLVGVASQDWGREPVNVRVRAFDRAAARDYLRSYPDLHRYGSESSARLSAIAPRVSLIAANWKTYGDLRALIDTDEQRTAAGGERLCLRVSGESVTLTAAESLDDGRDATDLLTRSNSDGPTVYADQIDVGDCAQMLADRSTSAWPALAFLR